MNKATKTIPRILKDNICTVFNLLNLLIAVMLAYVGAFKNLLFITIVMTNTVVGIIQEIKAKKQIEKLSLQSRPHATLLKGGIEEVVTPEKSEPVTYYFYTQGLLSALTVLLLQGPWKLMNPLLRENPNL